MRYKVDFTEEYSTDTLQHATVSNNRYTPSCRVMPFFISLIALSNFDVPKLGKNPSKTNYSRPDEMVYNNYTDL